METNKTELVDFLKNIEIATDYGLSIGEYKQIVDACIDLVKGDYREAIFYISMYTFKIGYLHGFKHCKDNGTQPQKDTIFNDENIIDINKDLEEFIRNKFYPYTEINVSKE